MPSRAIRAGSVVLCAALAGCDVESRPAVEGGASEAATQAPATPTDRPRREGQRSGWDVAAPGLEVGRFAGPSGSRAADAVVTVVRVDPVRYRFVLLSAKLQGLASAPTIVEWVERRRVTGAINASMYQADHVTAVGYMREGRRVNNPRWNGDKALFAAEPTAPGLPPAQILDRTCQDARALARRYALVVQSIRMVDCRGRNVWAAQPQRWSTACVGTDGQGRVLLVHCRRPLRTHDLVDALLAMPLGLRRLMYVEGGPEAALHVLLDGRALVSESGTFGEGGLLAAAASAFLPLPNALAFAPR